MVYHATRENDLPMGRDEYERTLMDFCHSANLSTPISLVPHFLSLVKFHVTHYLPRDFIEPVDFDKLIVEDIKEE